MNWHDVQQNTEEWMNLRIGKFTASMFADLFAAKSTLTYKKAINHVVFERLTGEQPESFTSAYMERGHDLEPLALETYSQETFNDVTHGGFFELNEYIGASPDGLVGSDGIVEVKCPAAHTLIEYAMSQKLPSAYYYQVHGQLLVTGRKWCDFIAYHPKLKPVIVRVDRDEAICASIQQELNSAIKQVELIISKIK